MTDPCVFARRGPSCHFNGCFTPAKWDIYCTGSPFLNRADSSQQNKASVNENVKTKKDIPVGNSGFPTPLPSSPSPFSGSVSRGGHETGKTIGKVCRNLVLAWWQLRSAFCVSSPLGVGQSGRMISIVEKLKLEPFLLARQYFSNMGLGGGVKAG